LSWEFEYGFQTSSKGSVSGFLGTLATRVKQLMKDISATIGVVTELGEKRCQQAADIALGVVLIIEEIVGK
jgi:hypothetical protein